MYSKARLPGKARFTFKPSGGCSKVHIAADFTNWKPVPLAKQKDGTFAGDFPLQSGSYQYRFIVDGNWTSDPDNSLHATNPFGSTNSVARI
ncbi:MAG: glycogen-binding domain-containing protein [Phycisphaerae bacterium]